MAYEVSVYTRDSFGKFINQFQPKKPLLET